MDADLAVGPVMQRFPSQPLSVFQAAEDTLDLLLASITGHHLFRRPVQAAGEQHGAAYTTTEEALKRGLIEIKLELPLAVARFQLIANYVPQELPGQPPLNLAPDALLGPTRPRRTQFLREASQRLQRAAGAGCQAVQLVG